MRFAIFVQHRGVRVLTHPCSAMLMAGVTGRPLQIDWDRLAGTGGIEDFHVLVDLPLAHVDVVWVRLVGDPCDRYAPGVDNIGIEVDHVRLDGHVVQDQTDLHSVAIKIAVRVLRCLTPQRPTWEVPVDRVADLAGGDDAAADVTAFFVGLVEVHRATANIVSSKSVQRLVNGIVEQADGEEILVEGGVLA
jgi:hypothetical protein